MKHFNHRIRTVLFFGIMLGACVSQAWCSRYNQRISFKHLSLPEGLSQSTVFHIVQDRNGYMWFATGNGLNRYDGYKFTVFQNDRKNPNSLLNNATRRLYFDRKGLLWVATSDGVSCYDTDREQWRNYPCRKGAESVWINDILELGEAGYLVGTSRGLFLLNEKFRPLGEASIGSVNVLFSFEDQILLGTSTGVYRFDPQSEKIQLLDVSLKGMVVNALLTNVYDEKHFWIGTENQGLYLYDLGSRALVDYRSGVVGAAALSSNTIRSLCYDTQHRLWVGTFVGLNILNELDGGIQTYFNRSYLSHEISQNSIRSLYRDSQGGMWCGTYFGGLNYYHQQKNQFEHLVYRPDERSLSDNVMSAIQEDRRGRMWIGTNDAGLNLFTPETGQFVYFRHRRGDSRGISGNNIKAISPSPTNDDLWIGIHGGGLCRYQAASGNFQRIHFAAKQFANDRVYALLFTQPTKLWIGTLEGLYLYDTTTGKAEELQTRSGKKPFANKSILSLYQDSEGGVWIGTQDGFFRYLIVSEEFDPLVNSKQPFEIHDQTYTFNQGQNGAVWIGTSGGLFAYDLTKKEYLDFSDSGFPSVSVFGILEDSFRRFWISTGDGLFLFDLNSGKWRRYSTTDGIQSTQFTPYSYCKTRSGKFYFGGINGVNTFSPEQLKDNPFAPQPLIDNLTVFNQRVVPGDATGILPEGRIHTQKKIRIPPQYTLWGLEFVVPNYLAGNNNQFAYCLEGFDKQWYYTNKTEVNYSNLSPGTYTFRVKAANNSGKWCEQPTELTIEVMPRWYQTWLARILFVLLLGGGVYAAMRFNLNRKLITRELELERLDKDRMRQMEQEKIRFFINVSHEFRTPLALILSPVQEALRKGIADKWLSQQLLFVQRNALRMLHLVNQVLDYRRAEMGAIELKVKPVQLEPLVRSIYELFGDLASGKKIRYEFESHLEGETCWIDPGYLERILMNLISNAMKFTPEQGTIVVAVDQQERRVLIRVSDTGCGIPLEKQSKVFDRFYQVEENAQGTGVGLSFVRNLVERHHGEISVQSEVGQGAVFTVSLPSDEAAYTVEERVVDSSDAATSVQVPDNYKNELTLLTPDHHWEEAELEEEGEQSEVRPRLLVVEDDKDIRNYLIQNLSKTYDVIVAENGQQGWDAVEQDPHLDLILSDVMMPVMDGIVFCKKVKRNIHYCHIPIILLTAKSEVGDELQGLQTGADDYISKPFVLAILESKIINILRQKRRIIRHYVNNIEISPTEITTNTLDEEMLDKARKIVIRRMENPDFSVEEMSREMGMSRSNLHLKMKAVTGESAIEFIRRIRLAEACRLLKEGRYNIAEISTYIGFTPSYFSTAFKKYIGCLPTEYNEKSKDLTNEK